MNEVQESYVRHVDLLWMSIFRNRERLASRPYVHADNNYMHAGPLHQTPHFRPKSMFETPTTQIRYM